MGTRTLSRRRGSRLLARCALRWRQARKAATWACDRSRSRRSGLGKHGYTSKARSGDVWDHSRSRRKLQWPGHGRWPAARSVCRARGNKLHGMEVRIDACCSFALPRGLSLPHPPLLVLDASLDLWHVNAQERSAWLILRSHRSRCVWMKTAHTMSRRQPKPARYAAQNRRVQRTATCRSPPVCSLHTHCCQASPSPEAWLPLAGPPHSRLRVAAHFRIVLINNGVFPQVIHGWEAPVCVVSQKCRVLRPETWQITMQFISSVVWLRVRVDDREMRQTRHRLQSAIQGALRVLSSRAPFGFRCL